jgi:hypothetical protein
METATDQSNSDCWMVYGNDPVCSKLISSLKRVCPAQCMRNRLLYQDHEFLAGPLTREQFPN